MQTVTTIGLDIAKSVFQVHGVDAGGQVVIRRQLKRRQVLAFFEKLPHCLVGIEASASSHHWARPTPGTWPYRAVDPAGLCEALRQTAEESAEGLREKCTQARRGQSVRAFVNSYP